MSAQVNTSGWGKGCDPLPSVGKVGKVRHCQMQEPAVLGSVVPLRQRAGGSDVFSNGRDQMSPQVGNTAQTCQQDLLVPVLQMVVPSDRLA